MPYFMDRHELTGTTDADIANAHARDLAVQDRYGVQYINYWYDYDRQLAFCLARGPNREAVDAVHREAHGLVGNEVLEVDLATVEGFLGRVHGHAPGESSANPAFRAILFTDVEGSTRLTQQLGDEAAMAVLRRHDAIVREALAVSGGMEVKHTGDGVMASFPSVSAAIRCAVQIQQALAAPSEGTALAVRIGVSAGEPVAERGDLFGSTVQLAARLCGRATPGSVLVSSAVRDLALGKGFQFTKRPSLRLKGFDEPVRAFEVAWDGVPSSAP